jgi:hypothetical protein
MKTIFTLMLGLVAGTTSFADSPVTTPAVAATQTRVVMTADHKIKLFVQPQSTNAQLTIRDDKGRAFLNNNVSLKKGWKQQFDVSELSVGTYKLTLTTGQQQVSKIFVVQSYPNESFIVQ